MSAQPQQRYTWEEVVERFELTEEEIGSLQALSDGWEEAREGERAFDPYLAFRALCAKKDHERSMALLVEADKLYAEAGVSADGRKDSWVAAAQALQLDQEESGLQVLHREMETGKYELGGVDLQGHPILVFRFARHQAAGTDVQVELLLMLRLIEVILEQSTVGVRQGVVFLCDCRNVGWANFDKEMERFFLNTIQKKVPLRIRHMFVFRAPFVFRAMLTLVRPFLSKAMKAKMLKINSDDALTEWIAPDQTPEDIGNGEAPLWDVQSFISQWWTP